MYAYTLQKYTSQAIANILNAFARHDISDVPLFKYLSEGNVPQVDVVWYPKSEFHCVYITRSFPFVETTLGFYRDVLCVFARRCTEPTACSQINVFI